MCFRNKKGSYCKRCAWFNSASRSSYLQYGYPYFGSHKCELGINIGRGEQNRPWVLGILIYEGDKLEGEVWFEPLLNTYTLLSLFSHCNFFYLLLFNSVAKQILFLCRKNIGGAFVPSPQVRPVFVHMIT
jgi:hypothetical protein